MTRTALAVYAASLLACSDERMAAPDGSAREEDAAADGAAAARDCLDGVDLEGGDALWPGYCEKHIDEGGDGRVDRVHSYAYDEDHRPLLYVVGEPPLGSQKRWTYDARGNLVLEEFDSGLDDVWEVTVERTYDEHDNLLTENTDDEGDGLPNRGRRLSYECWPEDEAMAVGPCTTELDLNGDDTVDLIQARVYDEEARLLTVTERRADNAELTRRTTHRYDSAGNRVMTEVDVGVDGLIEERIEREYDVDHRLLSTSTDRDDDGTAELRHESAFDDDGALIRETRYEQGNAVHQIDYERDERGLATRETETFFVAPQRDSELRRYHDSAGNPVLEVQMRRAADAPVTCLRYAYRCFD